MRSLHSILLSALKEKNKKLIIVIHGEILRILMANLLNLPLTAFNTFGHPDNCSVSEWIFSPTPEYEDDEVTLRPRKATTFNLGDNSSITFPGNFMLAHYNITIEHLTTPWHLPKAEDAEPGSPIKKLRERQRKEKLQPKSKL